MAMPDGEQCGKTDEGDRRGKFVSNQNAGVQKWDSPCRVLFWERQTELATLGANSGESHFEDAA